MGIESHSYQQVLSKLDKLIKKQQTLLVTKGLQYSFFSVSTLAALFLFVELFFRTSSLVRTSLFLIFIFALISSVSVFVIYPLLKTALCTNTKRYNDAAIYVAAFFPQVKDDLLNVMQLVSLKSAGIYSVELIQAAFFNVFKKVKDYHFEEAVSFIEIKKLARISIAIAISFALLFIFSPDIRSSAERLINYGNEYLIPQKFSFVVKPGNIKITKGDDVALSISATGQIPQKISLFYKDQTQTKYEKISLEIDSTMRWTYSLIAIRSNTNYYVYAEGIKSEQYTIEIVDRPIIKNLSIKVNPPSYSRLPAVEQSDNGNITGLVGSAVIMNIASSKTLLKARIVFADSSILPLTVNNAKAEGKFTLKKDNSYSIYLEDLDGNENLTPITYSIKVLFDASPIIEMIHPNKNINLGDDQRLAISAKISDDYGFSKLKLHYRLSASKYEIPHEKFSSIDIPFVNSEKEQIVAYIWNLRNLNLATEDVFSYYLEVFDNDNINGPKSTVTGMFMVRLPSIDEIFANVDKAQETLTKELTQTLKDAEELKEQLDKISKDIKQDKKELTWQEKEKIEKSIESFDKLQQKVDEISEKLNETKNQLEQNNLLSQETLEKYMELQKLMDEMTSEEMKKAMEKLQNTLQNLDRKQTQEALQNMKFDEEQFQKSIERTLNLLKRIQVEQKMDEVVRRSEDIQKKQSDLEKQTQNSDVNNKQQRDELAKKQNEISNDLKRFEQEMKDLKDKMSSLSDMPNEEMEKLSEEMDEQNNQELSEETKEQLKNQQKQQAQKSQKQLSQNMQKMNQSLMQMQSMMQQQNQMQTMIDLMKILNNLIALSKQQEELKTKTQEGDQSSISPETMKQQSGIKSNLEKMMNRLSELSQKTFAVTPEMGKALGDARREMDKSIESMQNRNSHSAGNSQSESMKSLNEASAMMKGSMDNMMQGGQGGGMMSLMQQLGQMSQQQMQLNSLTQMLQQMNSGQLNPEQQGQLQRLAQQQSLIQKSLEQLNKEARQSGKSKSIPSNLDDILNQMKEVITDMNTDNLDDKLLQKQERILSKLLDAQRSINERDFEKERKSNTGENVLRQSPAELNLAGPRNKNRIKDALNKAIQEGYSKDYEELIRLYYEALQKLQK